MIDNFQKISILLKEYDTLRAEILATNNNRNQFITIIFGAIAFGANRTIDLTFWIYSAVVLVGVCLFGGLLWNDVRKLSGRISELEQDINELAGGKHLLKWETLHSSAKGGFFGWFPTKRRAIGKGR